MTLLERLLSVLFRRRDILTRTGAVLFRRWFILPRLYLHHYLLPDEGPVHDHPWRMTSLTLWGGYVERLEVGRGFLHREFGPGSVVRRNAVHRHKITMLRKASSWSLVLRGPYEREWRFYPPGSRRGRLWYRFLGVPKASSVELDPITKGDVRA